VALCITLGAGASADGAGKSDTAYSALKFILSLKSPCELVAPYLPEGYSVAVTLAGSIADEMQSTLAALGLPRPRYRETYDGMGHFRLMLDNPDYPAETRDLLSGIINPIEMTETILRSIVKYRDEAGLRRMLAETTLRTATNRRGAAPRWELTFAPIGERFCYAYEDRGAVIAEEWLTELRLTADPRTRLVDEISLVKYLRTIDVHDAAKPAPVGAHFTYRIGYERHDTALLPRSLEVFIDSALSLTLTVAYRPEGGGLVLDSRAICTNQPSHAPACVTMTYGIYDRRWRALTEKNSARAPGGSTQLRAAAALSLKASRAFSDGAIGKAVMHLRTLIRLYPATPQAIEARKLLVCLPTGK
jgi:hypothetical protein